MKTILIIALTAFTTISFAQTKTDTAKKVTLVPPVVQAVSKPAPFKADPNRKYTIVLTEAEIMNTVQTSYAGIIPFLKTTDILAKYLDVNEKQMQTIPDKIIQQFNEQYSADKSKYYKAIADSTANASKKHK